MNLNIYHALPFFYFLITYVGTIHGEELDLYRHQKPTTNMQPKDRKNKNKLKRTINDR